MFEVPDLCLILTQKFIIVTLMFGFFFDLEDDLVHVDELPLQQRVDVLALLGCPLIFQEH